MNKEYGGYPVDFLPEEVKEIFKNAEIKKEYKEDKSWNDKWPHFYVKWNDEWWQLFHTTLSDNVGTYFPVTFAPKYKEYEIEDIQRLAANCYGARLEKERKGFGLIGLYSDG